MIFKDYGVGIKKVEHIFERYYRENQEKGGFGIGLNIVKSIIDKAGIDLQIDSQEGEGSVFTYHFFPPIFLHN
jgi:signal transduction histidine kinase